MSTTFVPANPKSKSPAQSSSASAVQDGIERRRRKRARISAQVHIGLAAHSAEPFEEVAKSIDVSRDGLLFISTRAGYWKGQALDITFPYSKEAPAGEQAQRAEVVRVSDAGNGQYHVAVQFVAAKADAKSERKRPGASASARADASANANARSEGAPPQAALAASAKQESIVLAVEPDQRIADMLKILLSQDGYTVRVVADAQQALDVLRDTIPAVFLAEVEGAEISGHDLCVIIKRNERLQHVPVILLTSSAQPADYSASHQLGAVVCMAKPFNPDRLRNVVRLVAPPPKAPSSAYGTSLASSAIERAL
ncbi:MAG: response regulator [Candidatus Acidiferrales bacterium]